MRRDFWNRLIEKYFEQLIDSVRVLRPHAIVLRRPILNIIVLRHASAYANAHMRCINNRLFQMPFERVESASLQPNARVFA